MKQLKSLVAAFALVAFAFAVSISAADNPAPADSTQKAATCCVKGAQTGTCPCQCQNQMCPVNATGDSSRLKCMGGSAVKCDSCACKNGNAGQNCCKKNCPKMKAGENPAK